MRRLFLILAALISALPAALMLAGGSQADLTASSAVAATGLMPEMSSPVRSLFDKKLHFIEHTEVSDAQLKHPSNCDVR